MEVLDRRRERRVRGGELGGVILFRRDETTDLTTGREVKGESWRNKRR